MASIQEYILKNIFNRRIEFRFGETDHEDDSCSGKATGNEFDQRDGAEASEAASITKRNLEVGLHKDAEG